MDKRKTAKYTELRRKKAAWCGTCMFLIAACACGIAWCAAKLAPYYGSYEYGRRETGIRLDPVEAPSLIEITISYHGDPPENVAVTRDGRNVPDAAVNYDYENRSVTVTLDTDVPSDGYGLSLAPADNMLLAYEVRIEPSSSYVDADAEWYAGPDGHLWLGFSASYPSDDGTLYCFLRGEGNGYQPPVYDARIDSGARYDIDVTALMEVGNVRVDEIHGLKVTFSGNAVIDKMIAPEAGNVKMASKSFSLQMAGIPEYDGDSEHDYDLSYTESYIGSLSGARYVPETRDENTDKEGAGAE